ncbi:MAG: hypothetical protein ACLGI6_19955 [Gammaproteobacteria bacterium]
MHHIDGTFHLYDAAHGGTDEPIESGTDLLHQVRADRARVARHDYPHVEQLSPGKTAEAQLTFERPDMVRQSFWVGREIDVYRDRQLIGKLTVTAIVAPALSGTPRTLAMPPATDEGTVTLLGLCLAIAVYLVFAVPTLWLGIHAYEPCTRNFEGGCSMGRGLLALASLIPAFIAAFIGWHLRRTLARHTATEAYAMPGGVLLGGAPLLYLLYTLKALFIG